MLFRIVALLWLIGATSTTFAQEAFSDGLPRKESGATTKSTAENAWIDFRQHPAANSRPQSAPSWVEAVSMAPTVEINGASAKTVFRIRIAHPPGDYQVLFFRLFFDDNSDARPELVAWDELGSQVLRSGELGSGVGLPTSDSIIIPMSGIVTLDIEVPGDGKTIRGAYLDWMTSSEVVHPLNTEYRDVIPEPFSSGESPDRFAAGSLCERRRCRSGDTDASGIGGSRLSGRDGVAPERDALSIHRVAARPETHSGQQLESRHQRCDHHQRRRDIDIGDSRDAGATKIYLGKIGLSAADRPLIEPQQAVACLC